MKSNVLYWVVTSLFAAFMLLSAIPDIILEPEAVAMISNLGYPEYFIVFIGIAKTLGAIAILIPGYPRIKEWAFAGMAYDLIAAVISILVVEGFMIDLLFMVLPFSLLIGSYILWVKRSRSLIMS